MNFLCYFWKFSVQSKLLIVYILLYCLNLYVWQCVEIASRNTLFVTSESETFTVNFGVLEKSIWSLKKSWKSPGKLFLKKGTNPVNLKVPPPKCVHCSDINSTSENFVGFNKLYVTLEKRIKILLSHYPIQYIYVNNLIHVGLIEQTV